MPTLLDHADIDSLNDAVTELLFKLQYATHGLPYANAINVAETLGQLKCMIVIHRMYGGISLIELTQWLEAYRPVIELLHKAEIADNGEEKAVK